MLTLARTPTVLKRCCYTSLVVWIVDPFRFDISSTPSQYPLMCELLVWMRHQMPAHCPAQPNCLAPEAGLIAMQLDFKMRLVPYSGSTLHTCATLLLPFRHHAMLLLHERPLGLV